MKKLLFVVLSFVLIAVLLGAVSCSASSSTTSTTTPGTGLQTSPPPGSTTSPDFQPGPTIEIKDFAFSPSTVTVRVGITVTWENQDSSSHTIVSDTGAFESGPLSNGQSFSFTFTQTGTYNYHCSIHTSMKGTVVVQ